MTSGIPSPLQLRASHGRWPLFVCFLFVGQSTAACSSTNDSSSISAEGGASSVDPTPGGGAPAFKDPDWSMGGAGDKGANDNSTDGAEGGAGGFVPEDEKVAEYQVETCPQGTVGFAEEVIEFSAGTGSDFGQDRLPDVVLGGPRGEGCCAGSLDVASLGDAGSIVLGFGGRSIVDGSGPDFVVFENVFWAGGKEEAAFVEWAQVEVSLDGETWFAFACDSATGRGCAGNTPTLAHPEEDQISVFDAQESGGDAFDLADLGLDEVRFVRITDLPDDDAVFDLDAVAIFNGRCLE